MEQAQEAAAEAEAQGQGCLGLEKEGGIVELELFEGIAQVGISGGLGGIEAAVDHGLGLFVARQGLGAGPFALRHGVADPGIPDIFDRSGKIADHAGRQFLTGDELAGAEIADLDDLGRGAGRHHFDLHAAADTAVADPAEDDDPLVGIVEGIKDQGLQGGIGVAVGRRDVPDHSLQHVLHADPLLGGDQRGVGGVQADDVLDLLADLLGLRGRQVDLVDDREDVQVVLQGQIDIGQGLGLDPLGRVDDQDGSVAGGQGPADLIVEVNMSWRIDQVEDILLSVPGRIDQTHGLGFDRDPSLPLQVHVVEDLVLHFTAGQEACLLDHPVCQSGFAVVDMGHDAEVSDFILCDFFLHKYDPSSAAGRPAHGSGPAEHSAAFPYSFSLR